MPEGASAWPNIIDHLLERVHQVRAGEIANLLHGRLQSVAATLF